MCGEVNFTNEQIDVLGLDRRYRESHFASREWSTAPSFENAYSVLEYNGTGFQSRLREPSPLKIQPDREYNTTVLERRP